MKGNKNNDNRNTNEYKETLTLKEQLTLSNEITIFCDFDIPTYVRFKLLQFQNTFIKDVKAYTEVNTALITKLSPDRQLLSYNPDGTRNQAYDQWLYEIKKVEEETKELTFEKLPLSSVLKIQSRGAFPSKLFYEDKACKAIFDKMLADEVLASKPKE